MRRLAFLCSLFLLVSPLAGSQNFSFESDRMPVVELTGHFRFHTGDDPRWSAPGFDDSSWQLLRSDQDWLNQGYRNYGGMAWYRFTLTVPPNHPPLALYVQRIRDSYQIFANGHLIGENGGMPPHIKVVITERIVYPISPNFAAPGQPVILAIRVWHWPHWAVVEGRKQGWDNTDFELPKNWIGTHSPSLIWPIGYGFILIRLISYPRRDLFIER